MKINSPTSVQVFRTPNVVRTSTLHTDIYRRPPNFILLLYQVRIRTDGKEACRQACCCRAAEGKERPPKSGEAGDQKEGVRQIYIVHAHEIGVENLCDLFCFVEQVVEESDDDDSDDSDDDSDEEPPAKKVILADSVLMQGKMNSNLRI